MGRGEPREAIQAADVDMVLLGGFAVRVAGRPVPDRWRLRNAKTLVKLLALADGHRMHRDDLAAQLWPDLGAPAAVNNLHGVACSSAGTRRGGSAGEGGDTELAWALRGGGGNFGVVTAMEFALHPVGPIVLGGPVFFRGDRVAEIAAGWREAIVGTPDELTTALALSTAPPVPFLPAESHGSKVVGVVACWSGSPEEGEEFIAPLRTLGEPLADLIGPIPYVALQQVLDPLMTAGAANYFGSTMLTELTDSAITELVDRHRAAPGLPTTCELHVHDISGAASRVPEDATAYSQRRPGYIVNCLARSPGLDGVADCAAWAREARDAVAVHGTGRTYVDYTGDVDADKVRATYPQATYDRLAVVKGRLDPANIFRFNQNIRPA